MPVLHNADVKSYAAAADIKDALARQLYQPVRWSETIRALAAAGVTQVAECGPGKVLAGLNKRIAADLQSLALTDAAALQGQSVGEGQRAGGHQGAILARLCPARQAGRAPPMNSQARYTATPAASIAGWRVHGLVERLGGAALRHPPQIETEHLARLRESIADHRQGLETLHHPDRLRPLAGEYESESHCLAFKSYQPSAISYP